MHGIVGEHSREMLEVVCHPKPFSKLSHGLCFHQDGATCHIQNQYGFVMGEI